jgi:hypothetical protein
MAMAMGAMPGGTTPSSLLPLRSSSPAASIPSSKVCGDLPMSGKICGELQQFGDVRGEEQGSS